MMEDELRLAQEHVAYNEKFKNPRGGLLGWTCDDPDQWNDLCKSFIRLHKLRDRIASHMEAFGYDDNCKCGSCADCAINSVQQEVLGLIDEC